MPVEILIHATDKAGGAKKGFPQTVRDAADVASAPWGTGEGLPDFIQLVVPDASVSQVENFLSNWTNEITYDLLASNAAGRRYKLSMNINIITEFGLDKAMRTEIHNYILNTYNAQLVEYVPAEAYVTYDIPNTDWLALQDDIIDKFEEQLDTNRYYFTDADVDLAIAAGGRFTLTTAQVLNRIVDRLA